MPPDLDIAARIFERLSSRRAFQLSFWTPAVIAIGGGGGGPRLSLTPRFVQPLSFAEIAAAVAHDGWRGDAADHLIEAVGAIDDAFVALALAAALEDLRKINR